jgi:predicted esterase
MLMPGSAEKWVERASDMLTALKDDVKEPEITAVVEPRCDGARITKAVIEFSGEVPDVEKIEVLNRTVTQREVNGSTVTLYLSENDKASKILPAFEFKPGGPGGPGGPGMGGKPKGPRITHEKKILPPVVEVKIPGIKTPIASSKAVQNIIDDFIPGTYKRILYNLYVPKNYDPAKKYPLVMFTPDASANGSNSKLALYQGIGATCWAEPEIQEKNPCFVLAVEIPLSVQLTNDDHTASDELSDIKALLDETIEKYSIDTKRIYTTGQSQGCMASCELNIRYPDLFAASMLISGHWDIEKMTKLTNKKFFFGLSEGGRGEYPNFNAITDGLEANGVNVSRVRLNFREGFDVNEQKVRAATDGAQVVYAIFDKDTAFPEGEEVAGIAHHNRGWELCYQLKSALEWILAQSN